MSSKKITCLIFEGLLLSAFTGKVHGTWWNGQGDTKSDADISIFGEALTRDWLYSSSSISIKYEGCVVGYSFDNEDAGCPENESEDGTTYWYMMANCMRPQATYSLYASDSSSGCSSTTFKESLVTTTSFQDFLYYLQNYDQNGNFNDYNYDDGDGGNYGVDDLPTCEESDYGYLGLGCDSYGNVVLRLFEDQYCLGVENSQVYDNLNNVNRALKSYKGCVSAYKNGDDDDNGNLAQKLVTYSNSCSSIDNNLCQNEGPQGTTRISNKVSATSKIAPGRSWVTKLKYVAGGMLLVASFVMFTGILFTNRRRRRALMQRKYRQSKKGRSSRSKSASNRYDETGSRKSGRSKSRNRDDGGVLT